jgi:hypothetical protein
LQIASVSETVVVTAQPDGSAIFANAEEQAKKIGKQQQTAASPNVTNLQRRVAGVLPVAVDVPRAGNSYRFVRPLVLDEETRVTFTYKTK